MKSSFLSRFAFLLLILSSAAHAQIPMFAQTPLTENRSARELHASNKPKEKQVEQPRTGPATVIDEKSTFDRFSDRVRIGYFGVVTTPNLHEIQRGNWSNGAISPEFSNGTNNDEWPPTVWHQLSFSVNFGATLNFFVNPRFVTPLGNPSDRPDDKSFVALDDLLVGFQGVAYSSADKKLNVWIRPGVRLNTSRASRDLNRPNFGELTHQLEFAYLPTYDFNKKWQVGIFGMGRQWVSEDRYSWARLRFWNAFFVQYTLDDTTRLMLYHENMIENRNRWKDQNGRTPYMEDVWQTIMVGVNKDVTKRFNAFPYIAAYINDPVFSARSFFLGAWLQYQFK